MKQHIDVGGVTGDLDFGMVLFLTQQIGTHWFNDQFEFKGKEPRKFSSDIFFPTYNGMKSRYGVI